MTEMSTVLATEIAGVSTQLATEIAGVSADVVQLTAATTQIAVDLAGTLMEVKKEILTTVKDDLIAATRSSFGEALANVKEDILMATKKVGFGNDLGSLLSKTQEGTSSAVGAVVNLVVGNRTGIEKALIAGGVVAIGFGLFKARKAGMFKGVSNYLFKKENVVLSTKTIDANVMESTRSGSTENPMTTPSCQAKVGYLENGDFHVLGGCVRMENFLVSADHVIGGDDVKYVQGRQGRVSLEGKTILSLATDLSAIQMTEKELSIIGVATCNIGPIPENGVYAAIVGPFSQGTAGTLVHDERAFGRVVYKSTTLSGYSGSPYTVGPKVVAIHQNGGAVNGGVSASYVWMLLKHAMNRRCESSEDWLRQQFQREKKLRYCETGDPDEVQVRVDGQYTTVQRRSLLSAFGTDWEAKLEKAGGARGGYSDVLEAMFRVPSASGEANSSQRLGASSIMDGPQGTLIQQNPQPSTSGLRKLSKKDLVNILRSPEQLQRRLETMNGRESPVQLESVTV
uniref:Peptidase S39 domain-containing protein n=1 Tax=Riboviria sp. TaxID=2585031 RepID=A0A8K1U2Q8_9VIRU|nr:MAG: hypothetical protein 1 [Riboviria sp.]